MSNSFGTRLWIVSAILVLLFLHSKGAGEEPRKWTSSSGKFSLTATFVKQDEGEVELLKADGSSVTISVESLSEADQNYLKALNPFGSGGDKTDRKMTEKVKAKPTTKSDSNNKSTKQPSRKEETNVNSADTNSLGDLLEANEDVQSFDVLRTDGEEIVVKTERPMPIFEPDLATTKARFQKFSQPTERVDAYARVSKPVLIDPAIPKFAVSIHRESNSVRKEQFGRLYLLDPDSKPDKVLDMKQTFKILDHHVKSGKSLGLVNVEGGTERKGDLVLLENLADGKPKAIGRWKLPGWEKPGFGPKVEFAKFMDGNRVILLVNGDLLVHDLKENKSVFCIRRVRSSKIQASPNGKILALPTGGGCQIIDTVRGELIGKISIDTTLTPEVRFSLSGDRLALVAGSQHAIWDFKRGEMVGRFGHGSSSGTLFGWVGKDYLVTQLGGLIDVKLETAVWKYYAPFYDGTFTMDGGIAVVRKEDFVMLYLLPMPHDPVNEVIKTLEASKDTFVVREGTRMSLDLSTPRESDKKGLKRVLQDSIEEAGWQFDTKAKTKMVVKIRQGEEEELYFRSIYSFSRPSQKVKAQLYKVEITIKVDGKAVWTREEQNMLPTVLHLKRDEKLEDALKRYEKPNPDYFKLLGLPARIIRPDLDLEIGRSNLSKGNWSE